MRFAREIADDIGPFARRGESDRARPLADRQAFDCPESDIRLVREPFAKRGEQPRAKRPGIRFAGDAHEKGGGGHAALSVHVRSSRAGGSYARRPIETLSAGHGRSLAAPPAASRKIIGARQVSWLAAYRRRRLPGLGFKSSGEKSVGTPLTVAGAATDRRGAYRVPFSPSGKNEGPCVAYVPASAGVVK